MPEILLIAKVVGNAGIFYKHCTLHRACSWWLLAVLGESRGYPFGVFCGFAEANDISQHTMQNKVIHELGIKLIEGFGKRWPIYCVIVHYVMNQ